MECIFCKIVKREINTNFIYEDKKIVAFNDTTPVAPCHFLVIPKEHIESVNEITEKNSNIISHIFENIVIITNKLKIIDGYRIVTNCGKLGGQTVNHLHFHVLANRTMSWPPG